MWSFLVFFVFENNTHLKKKKKKGLPNKERSIGNFFPPHTRSSVLLLEMMPKSFSPLLFSELWRVPVFCDVKYFANPATSPGCSTKMDGVQHLPCCRSASAAAESLFHLRLLKRPSRSLHVTRCKSSQSCRVPSPPLQCYPYDLPANGIFSCTTSWQAMSRKPEPPASEINGECECCSFQSTKNTEENKPTPAKREAVRERVGEAWIVWSVAQTTGSLW